MGLSHSSVGHFHKCNKVSRYVAFRFADFADFDTVEIKIHEICTDFARIFLVDAQIHDTLFFSGRKNSVSQGLAEI